MNVLQTLQEHAFGFHDLINFLNLLKKNYRTWYYLAQAVRFFGQDILGILSHNEQRLQYLSKISFIISGTIPFLTFRAALKKRRRSFQRNMNYSHEISKLCNFLFENNKKQLPLRHVVLFIPELLVICICEVWHLIVGGAYYRPALILIWVSIVQRVAIIWGPELVRVGRKILYLHD